MATSIIILSVIGFLLSCYAYHIGKKAEQETSYKSICDIQDNMSCSKAFSSGFGKIAGFSNSIVGILFYLTIFVLVLFQNTSIIFYLSIVAVLVSLYLAYLLYFKLKNFCLICNGIYVVNILLLIFSYRGV